MSKRNEQGYDEGFPMIGTGNNGTDGSSDYFSSHSGSKRRRRESGERILSKEVDRVGDAFHIFAQAAQQEADRMSKEAQRLQEETERAREESESRSTANDEARQKDGELQDARHEDEMMGLFMTSAERLRNAEKRRDVEPEIYKMCLRFYEKAKSRLHP